MGWFFWALCEPGPWQTAAPGGGGLSNWGWGGGIVRPAAQLQVQAAAARAKPTGGYPLRCRCLCFQIASNSAGRGSTEFISSEKRIPINGLLVCRKGFEP